MPSNDNIIDIALQHLAATPSPSHTDPDLVEVRRVANRVAFRLWSGDIQDRDDLIAAFVRMYGPNPKVQSILHDQMADRTRHTRRAIALRRSTALSTPSVTNLIQEIHNHV